MKYAVAIVMAVVLLLSVCVFVPKLVHTCDDCGRTFVGLGYWPNLKMLPDSGQKVICKSCAQAQHEFSIIFGKTVEDYRKPLF